MFKNKKALWGGLAIFIAGILFWVAFTEALHYTNSTGFCISCHSMQTNMREYKETVHYKNASGVSPGCADCHVPKAFFPKIWMKIMAYKDVLGEITGKVDTPEKFNAHRWEMASQVWEAMEASDSVTCRSCHSWDSMDLSEQDRSARKRHARARDEGKTCIDCHKGIAHEEPDEPEEDEEPTT